MSIFYRIKSDFARALGSVHYVEEGEPSRRPFFVALMVAHVASIPGITQDAVIAAAHYMRGIFTSDMRGEPRTHAAIQEAQRCETTQGDILAQDLATLARELRRVDAIIRTECAIDDECEDQDREWEVTPSEALDLCHRAYDLMQSNRLTIFVMVLSVPACDVAQNARACFDALTELRMPLLAPFDEERPLARLRSRMGFDAKRPAHTPKLRPTNLLNRESSP